MKNKFDAIERALKDHAKKRNDHKVKLRAIKADQDYSDDWKDKKIKSLESELRAVVQSDYEKVSGLVRDLLQAIEDKRKDWPGLGSAELSNVLKLIELSGPDLEGDTVRLMVDQLRGDYQSLKAIQKALQSQGVKYDGGLSELIYELDFLDDRLRDVTYHAFYTSGNVNDLSSAIRKIAVREKVDFPAVVDGVALDERIRQSAGLPAESG